MKILIALVFIVLFVAISLKVSEVIINKANDANGRGAGAADADDDDIDPTKTQIT